MNIYRLIQELDQKGEAGVLCMIVETEGSTPRHMGSKMLVYPDGHFVGSVGGGEVESRVIQEALQALAEDKPRLLRYSMVDPNRGDPGVCGGQLEVYVEPIQPRPMIVVIGAGHVGKAVAHLASWLNFRVAVSDDRPEFCTPEANPEADYFACCPLVELPKQLKIDRQTYLVLTTRGAQVDIDGLPALLETPAAYIGVIGSKRRWLTARKAMIEAGISDEKLNRVHSPMGLELKVETPEEIALSIMAEIVLLRNGGTGKSMKM